MVHNSWKCLLILTQQHKHERDIVLNILLWSKTLSMDWRGSHMGDLYGGCVASGVNAPRFLGSQRPERRVDFMFVALTSVTLPRLDVDV